MESYRDGLLTHPGYLPFTVSALRRFFCTVYLEKRVEKGKWGFRLRARSPALWLFSEFSQAFYPSDLSFPNLPTLWGLGPRMDIYMYGFESIRILKRSPTLLIGNSPIQNVFGVNNNNKSPRLCLESLTKSSLEIDLWSFPGSDPSLLFSQENSSITHLSRISLWPPRNSNDPP